jgi:hypothetical protein
MSVKVASNRFIISSKYAALYQQIHGNISDFQRLGQWLTAQAGELQAFRHIEGLKSVADVLINFPLKEYQLIGQYYLAWCGYREGRDVRSDLETVIEQSTSYRSKALLSLAAVEAGNYDSEIMLYKAAAKWGSPSIVAQAARGIAITKAREGSHQRAVKDLENMTALIRSSDRISYLQYLNSLACELGEIGRIEEAQNICSILLASPYAFAYPEWRETGKEIALRGYKSRSSVSITQANPGNLLYIPEREASDTSIQSELSGPAPVFSLEKWKEEKMVKEPNGETEDENVDEMDDKDLLATLIQIAARDDVDEEKLRDVVKYAIKTIGMPKQK